MAALLRFTMSRFALWWLLLLSLASGLGAAASLFPAAIEVNTFAVVHG